MKGKMSWKEIKSKFPNEWVEIVDFETDGLGSILYGIVLYHNPSKRKFVSEIKKILDNSQYNISAQRYTGEHKSRRYWRMSVEEENAA